MPLAKGGGAVYQGFPDFVVRENLTSRTVVLSGLQGDEGSEHLRFELGGAGLFVAVGELGDVGPVGRGVPVVVEGQLARGFVAGLDIT